jgi:hypothetical protein
MYFKLLISLLLYQEGSGWLNKMTELRICGGIHLTIRLRYITEKHRRRKITDTEIIAKESLGNWTAGSGLDSICSRYGPTTTELMAP